MIAVTDPFITGRPRYIGPELRGPADADGFRVKVGRYGDRWYTDQLPGDDIAPASEWVGPSISICKKASGNDWSFVALKRVAEAMETEKYRNLARWPYADRYEALKAINKVGLNAAAQRGTNIHLAFDALLHGAPMPITDDMPGADYRSSVDQFFAQYHPTLVVAEFVCIHRDLNDAGYGGTCDAIIEIDDELWIVDWKSRGEDSEHGAYPEEAAQVAGYWGSQYIIVEGPGGPERRLMPKLKGGLIVSIKPDGCRVYPVDLDAGFEHWTALHAWWVARRDERKPLGRQWAARKSVEGVGDASAGPGTPSTTIPADLPSVDATGGSSSTLGGEIDAGGADPSPALPVSLDVGGVGDDSAGPGTPPTLAPDPARLALVQARDALCPSPDEGGDWSSDEFKPVWDELKALFDDLDPDARAWRSELVGQAQRRNVPFHAQGGMTERRYYLNRAVIALAVAGDDDAILRELLAHLVGDVALFPSIEPGHVLGSLSHVEAERFARHVDAYLSEPLGAA